VNHRISAVVAVALLAFGASACGDDAGTTAVTTAPPSPVDPAGAACLVGDIECYETGAPIAVDEPSSGMCARDVTDCDDTSVGNDRCLPEAVDCVDTVGGVEWSDDAAREQAQGLLGRGESDLDADVRIARRGAETMALTEDYVVGRITVELDDTDGSGERVVTATVELPDGPARFELQPG